MYIAPISYTNDVPADLIALFHVQPWKISIYVAINWRHLVTRNEFWATFYGLDCTGIVGVLFNVVIQEPALVLVKLSKKDDKFFIDVSVHVAIFY